jgi:predicted nucleotidyltransferase
MKNFQKIIDSFSVQKTLNPKVWENPDNPKSSKMKDKVRQGLLKIAEKFVDDLGEDVFVDDIVLTGSLANFNWSEFSDFDLHVIIDFEQFDDESKLYKENFNLKKQIFNEKHNIKIYGYDVELYAQDAEESHFSTGVFSVMNDEWVSSPRKLKFELDKSSLEKKITQWTEKIDSALEKSKDKDGKVLNDIREKLKDYRKSGLEGEGELSYENLVFKFLRRSGHIQKLFDTLNKKIDKDLSIETKIEESN